jgi:S-formylglutathione hydrolase FrmB
LPVLLLLLAAVPARANFISRYINPSIELDRVNRGLKGRVLDFTYNHGTDRRIWSEALGEKRDLYVYVPPGYNPCQPYPLAIYMHGFGQDEHAFLQVVDRFDEAMVSGRLPPFIIAAVDGSTTGRPSLLNAGSFYVNSRAGRFEDYVMQDVWTFLHGRFLIRAEREAHALLGGSMGGFGAYNLGIKYRPSVGIVAGILPPLNTRYMGCHGDYFENFDPTCIRWRESLNPRAPLAFYLGGLVKIRERRMTDPLFGRGNPDALALISMDNPAEMLTTYDVKPGELEMFVGYGGHDNFNLDAQAESFLYLARCRGLAVTSIRLPFGHHNSRTGKRMIPYLIDWLAPRLAPYSPGYAGPPARP